MTRVTWWGHATSTVEIGGVRVLTDPVFTARVAHLYRPCAPVPSRDAVRADLAIISHLHADHLHLPSLRRLGAGTRVVAPAGTAKLLARRLPELAARVEEVRPGDLVHAGAVTITATPAWHDGRRMPGSSHHGPALGYVLRDDETSVWFAGDTGLFDGLAEIGPVDTALVPVGGWGPTLGPHHLDPDQAADAVERVGARQAIPIHYGTFWPTGLRHVAPTQYQHKCLEPGVRFEAALGPLAATAHVVRPGESVEL